MSPRATNVEEARLLLEHALPESTEEQLLAAIAHALLALQDPALLKHK